MGLNASQVVSNFRKGDDEGKGATRYLDMSSYHWEG